VYGWGLFAVEDIEQYSIILPYLGYFYDSTNELSRAKK
jgi:hypothetical protein